MLLYTGKLVVSYRGPICELNAFTEAMGWLLSAYNMELSLLSLFCGYSRASMVVFVYFD